jgi:hypothetical protein
MGLSKRKCDIERTGKMDFSKYCPAKKEHIFGKEVLRETCEKSNAVSRGKKS